LVPQTLETSNVQVVTEMVNMITAQRSYEMDSKCITANTEMMTTVVNLQS
jgi:flagellar basal-body rod protein FlgG